MNLVFFTYYYPPDLSAGSFRAKALVDELSKSLKQDERLHIISTQPNRYDSYREKAPTFTQDNNVYVYRIKVPSHFNKTINQAWAFTVYFFKSFFILRKINPNFIICTTGRHMTSAITYFFSFIFRVNYYVEFRDIFSETIAEIYSRKNKYLGTFLKKIFLFLEKLVLKKAKAINVVSEAFFSYYSDEGLDTSKWSFFPNGIDEEFMNISNKYSPRNKKKTILYAGNIGEGQGLEIIIPNISMELSENYKIIIIGDGVMKTRLQNIILEKSISNVQILEPMSRQDLNSEYINCDILFLHLNNLEAFKRSLPSKIFEYAVIGKPIIGGLSGYSSEFLEENIPHSHVFQPGDTRGCLDAIKKAEQTIVRQHDIEIFKSKYSRSKIMNSLSSEILRNARTYKV